MNDHPNQNLDVRRPGPGQATDRRSFIKHSAAAGVGLGLGARALSAATPRWKPRRQSSKTLVTLFLRGGADAVNLIAPT